MGNEAVLKYVILNGKVKSTSDVNPLELIKGKAIYEVIRMKDGSALYMEEHIERMRESAKLIGAEFQISDDEIKNEIRKLASSNSQFNMNVKLLATNFTNEGFDFAVYFIKSFYPPEQMYEKGIHTILYMSERENPHAKTVNKEQREKINKLREREGAFEALLVNGQGHVTEGSRSNLFFVKDSKIYTPPAGEVLLGITRKKVVEICRKNEIDIVEYEIDAKSLDQYDGAFITGTSINVLPIATIGSTNMDSTSNEVIILLMGKIKEEVSNYIRSNKL